MPIYHFAFDVPLPSQVVAARLQAFVRQPRGFFESIRNSVASPFKVGSSDNSEPPFLGKVNDDSFRVRRDIRYRNSFLPLIWGRIASGAGGSHLSVTMFLHPFVAAFMAFWFSGVGYGAWRFLTLPSHANKFGSFIPAGMFVFGIALVCGGFFPEALKARRLLEDAVKNPVPDKR